MGNFKVVFLAINALAINALAIAFQINSIQATFSDSTYFYWGPDRAQVTGPDSVDLKLIEYGGSDLTSTVSYMYGSVSMQIKLIAGNSAGTVTTFYLSSEGEEHDEIDFEFLGNVTGEPYTIHTNIFTKGVGKREQQFKAWFDLTDGFHTYTIQWTPYSVVWLVDNTPIRVFRNHHDTEINFPDSQPMKAYASLWNADDWATQGGTVKTDWDLGTLVANFQAYKPNACICLDQSSVWSCSDSSNPANWWTNAGQYYQLAETQYYDMDYIRNNYKIYDYCLKASAAGVYKKECHLTQN